MTSAQVNSSGATRSVVRAADASAQSLSEPYLVLHDIHKTFGQFVALRDISLEIHKGEFVCFLGPSGCGKTTLLRIIAGLERQTAGTIRQDGRDVSTLATTDRDYGIVFQSYALFPNLTVFDNIAYGLVSRRVRGDAIAERVHELLGLIGLPKAGSKYPNHLSGGEQQRVALARALATSPGLLLLDEPLSALDAIVRLHLRHEIRALQRRLGVTTIMVTHDQEEALTMADRIVVMNHGVINQVGSPRQIYREPATPFAANFVGKANVIDGTIETPGRVRIGSCTIDCPVDAKTPGAAVRVYLRPEDIVPCENTDAAIDCTVQKIDFLGSYCLARVAAGGLGQSVTMFLSLNNISELGLEEGSSLRVRILNNRVRVFDA